MATPEQRVQAYCDALINASATQAQKNRLGIALATQAGALLEYQSGDATQKARVFLDAARAFAIDTVKSTEAASAAQSAANAAAAAADSALPETP